MHCPDGRQTGSSGCHCGASRRGQVSREPPYDQWSFACDLRSATGYCSGIWPRKIRIRPASGARDMVGAAIEIGELLKKLRRWCGVRLVQNYKRTPKKVEVERQSPGTRNVYQKCPPAKKAARPRLLIWKIRPKATNIHGVKVAPPIPVPIRRRQLRHRRLLDEARGFLR